MNVFMLLLQQKPMNLKIIIYSNFDSEHSILIIVIFSREIPITHTQYLPYVLDIRQVLFR